MLAATARRHCPLRLNLLHPGGEHHYAFASATSDSCSYSRLRALRAFSFDETRLDDKTHGDGAKRSGRTERTFRAGKWDEGVCIGQKSASHTASLVGGSVRVQRSNSGP